MSILQSRSSSFRFSDGSFSLTAPFWLTLPRGAFRLLWIWGLFALVLWFYRKLPRRPMLLALAWIALALIPYSFLTYGQNIPSRQVYLASAGLAMLVGLVYQSAVRPFGSQAAALVAAAILVYNVAPLWTKKKNQFIERAAPTTRLIQQARSTSGPIHVRCFPQSKLIGEEAVRLAVPEAIPRLIWEPPDSGCRSPE